MKCLLLLVRGLCVVLGLWVGTAGASTILVDPPSQEVSLGPFSITIRGEDFEETFGGPLTLNFDVAFMSYDPSGTTPISPWLVAIDDSQAAAGQLDFDFLVFSEQEDEFGLVTVGFNATGPSGGPTPLDLEVEGGFWAGEEMDERISVDTRSGSVTVVPVPIAVWLFGSALLALGGFTRFRRHERSRPLSPQILVLVRSSRLELC